MKQWLKLMCVLWLSLFYLTGITFLIILITYLLPLAVEKGLFR